MSAAHRVSITLTAPDCSIWSRAQLCLGQAPSSAASTTASVAFCTLLPPLDIIRLAPRELLRSPDGLCPGLNDATGNSTATASVDRPTTTLASTSSALPSASDSSNTTAIPLSQVDLSELPADCLTAPTMTAHLGPVALTLPPGEITARLTLFVRSAKGETLVDVSFFTLRPRIGGSVAYQLDPFLSVVISALCACDAPCDEHLTAEERRQERSLGLAPVTYSCLPSCIRQCVAGRTGALCTDLDRGLALVNETDAGRCHLDQAAITAAAPVSPAPTAGNGVVESGEACDDGNVRSGDGCDGNMQPELGYGCPPAGGACHDVDECLTGTLRTTPSSNGNGNLTLTAVAACPPGLTCLNLPGSFACCDAEGGAVDPGAASNTSIAPVPIALNSLAQVLGLAQRGVALDGLVELAPGRFACADGFSRLDTASAGNEQGASSPTLALDSRGVLVIMPGADLPVCLAHLSRRVAVTENQVYQMALQLGGALFHEVTVETASPVPFAYTASTGVLVAAITASLDFDVDVRVRAQTLAGHAIDHRVRVTFVVAPTLRRTPRILALPVGRPTQGIRLGVVTGGRPPYRYQLSPQLLPLGLEQRTTADAGLELVGNPRVVFPPATYRLYAYDTNEHAVEVDAVSISVVPALTVAGGLRQIRVDVIAGHPFLLTLPQVRGDG